jgi:hypothetical protein
MQQFQRDLEKLYDHTKKRQEGLSEFYRAVDDEGDNPKRTMIDGFLNTCKIASTKESRLAVATRIVTLRDDLLSSLFKKEGLSEEQVIAYKEQAYQFSSAYHLELFEKTFDYIEQEKLFTPFYQAYLKGIHEIGVAFTAWQSAWTQHILCDINRALQAKHGDDDAIHAMLHTNGFIDEDFDGSPGDRSYSALVREGDEYTVKAYRDVFPSEVLRVVGAIDGALESLDQEEDAIYGQKEPILAYFQAIKIALCEQDRHQLIRRWADVDRAWMAVTIPFQPGHPLEYYEDKFRKAVALEWDIRLSSPYLKDEDRIRESVRRWYRKLFLQIDQTNESVLDRTLDNLKRVQLYVGRPLFYYGANFLGLFSAQVVPNDENVSKEHGKKIFAYADNVLASLQAKPFMKIQREVFGQPFMDKERHLIFKEPALWHQVYRITTLGHEYGHILWLDSDTETRMNQSGAFKNIEEFKATTGGLMAYFHKNDGEGDEADYYVFSDTLKRAVGLIAWMESEEVEAYYCEGLIHLHGLFSSGVVRFKNKLIIDMSNEAYARLKAWYQETYKELAQHYLEKRDAKEFLNRYAYKEGRYYRARDESVNYFVNYYWNLYQEIGMEIDHTVDKAFYESSM